MNCDSLSEREVLARARALLDRTRETFPGWSPPPFEPRLIAEAAGIPVVLREELPYWDALLIPRRDGGFRIVCDAGASAGRRRFSIAHELAHTLFPGAADAVRHRAREPGMYRTAADRRVERLCDQAAAELLMPVDEFRAALANCGRTASGVMEAARMFAVSREAAAVRTVETSDPPCAVGFFEWKGAGPHGKRHAYRVRRVFSSRKLPFLFPRGRSVPEESVVYQASLGKRERMSEEVFSLGQVSMQFQVSAFPLHRGEVIEEPPVVCAVMESV